MEQLPGPAPNGPSVKRSPSLQALVSRPLQGGDGATLAVEGSGGWGCWGVPRLTQCHAPPGVTIPPAPKSRLRPEPAQPAGQGAPSQRIPAAPARGRGQVGRGHGHA